MATHQCILPRDDADADADHFRWNDEDANVAFLHGFDDDFGGDDGVAGVADDDGDGGDGDVYSDYSCGFVHWNFLKKSSIG